MARRRAVAALAALVTLLGVLLAPSTVGAQPASPEPAAWIVVDAGTGKVLAAKDPHTARPPASTAKIMTALTAVERLPAGATVKVSELAASQPASKINMVAGQEWPLEDALASLMLASANDAAYAIAESTSGSLDGFAAALTSTARRFGMTDSTFADPAGFDDASAFGGGPRMSTFDIAISARNALAVPQLAFLAALREHQFVDPSGATRHLTNHNKLLPGNSAGYEGATGFKTGYTRQAGHTLVATATRGDRTLIVVVLDTYDTYGWAHHLLDQGFATAPDDPGTGEELPEVRASPFAQRQADLAAFTKLATGAEPVAAATPATAGDGTTATALASASAASAPTSAASTASASTTTAADASGGEVAATGTSGSASSSDSSRGEQAQAGGGGGSNLLRNLLLVVLAALVVLVQLRRRAVKRRRALRLARRQATARAMRRGALQVVDHPYRNGRNGPPTASHVRVSPIRGDGEPRTPRAPRG